tara:strand:+ start:4643 stop:5023 length:381 start_codon:yes stop_codon:yes gene_type:complete
MKINTFDIDGVIYFGEKVTGVRPCDGDIIITGRPFSDREETIKMLESRGIYNTVFMNPLSRGDNPHYGRKASGIWKGHMIQYLKDLGYEIGIHFEDDPVQIKEIEKRHPDLSIVHLKRKNEEYVKY